MRKPTESDYESLLSDLKRQIAESGIVAEPAVPYGNAPQGDYQTFFAEIKERISAAQQVALRAANQVLIELYWSIGQAIVEKQAALGWGRSVVEQLSNDLQAEMPGTKGFSAQNLWYMRQFYIEYHVSENLQPLVGEISWSKHVVILSKCKDDLQREFYIKMTRKFGWTKAVLTHHIDNQRYEKYLLGQTNFDQTLPEQYRHQAKLAFKDEYTFDFLGLGEEHSERELELALLGNIRQFLIEMGGDFAFMGNQYPIRVGNRDFAIDLLLYHRRLRCLVPIDLKIREFEPEHKGKLDFYITALNEQLKLPGENDAIGIIICKSKDNTVVEYALKSSSNPIGVATYAITSKLPEELAPFLPSEEVIRKNLGKLDWGQG